ncbi:cytochrome P450 [Streptococcus oralis]|uniref:Tetratricopeptide repeat protein n=1 Tax=Streptococcus oralis subsp. tigurinus TaxID=1077464 RepID=A0A1X1GEX9_STROR|nr:hypothetical protein [Streptococcus oralis]MCY7092222.1 cytochrome P450 [Streptococcus oralis]ORO45458.1 hypothetical protein B7725_06220 [Streptococcus oralis subsp. tigurinus]ORO46727.1 hypothetical protein B7724_08595 [Streptococcus oralis subsp. tigurinus]
MSFDEKRVLQFYKELPDETTSSFSKSITDFVVENINLFYNREMIDFLYKKVNSSTNEIDNFPYFYTLVVFYRRMRSNTELKKLIDNNEELYGKKPLFLFTKSSYELSRNKKDSYEAALKLAEECIDIINNKENDYDPDYPGFYNHYASVVAAYFEQNYSISNEQKKLAYEYIKKCLKKYNSATYYITLARLELIDNNFEDSNAHILYAIDIENDRARIPEYNDLLLKVEYKKTINELTRKSNQITDILNDNKTNILEYLAFFSGIIAFLISSGNIAVNNPEIAMKLILLMLGALLIGFSAFTLLIQNNNKKILSVIITTIIGIILIILSNYWIN